MLAWMVVEKNIEPHVPVWDKTEHKDDSLSSKDFHWNPETNEYRCPVGKPLRSEWRAFTQKRFACDQSTPSSTAPAKPTVLSVR